uniref:Uncharacterized protein n=1 Tax=Peronospora matthiolae TaxID=2874970 RepID=A0AAV1TT20_9STRA
MTTDPPTGCLSDQPGEAFEIVHHVISRMPSSQWPTDPKVSVKRQD